MKYQDTWSDGEAIERGYRECSGRYEIVRRACSELFGSSPFSVLDIGAAQGYFAARLTEDFRACRVTAYEPRLRRDQERVIWEKRKLTINEARTLSGFDLVLALSVLHHMREPFEEWVLVLCGVGKNVLCELAVDDSRSSSSMARCYVPSDATLFGYGDSHIKSGAKRPIVLLKGKQ